MTDDVLLSRRLSLVGRIPKMICVIVNVDCIFHCGGICHENQGQLIMTKAMSFVHLFLQ